MAGSEARKAFVLDTNVILHDSSCLTRFAKHAIVIPITVLEELDQFKKGNQRDSRPSICSSSIRCSPTRTSSCAITRNRR